MTARDPAFVAALRRAVNGEVREAESLGRYSTYRIGGPATVFLPAVPSDISPAVRLAAERGVRWFALGLGSNILLPDEGLDALVIRLGKGLDGVASEGEHWTLGAGLPAPLAARRTAEAGWGGLHKMVGVPGTVGGGVFMNAGCHGTDWAAVVRRVTVVRGDGTTHHLERAEIPFRYRSSGLEGAIVLETEVRLLAESPDRLNEEVSDLFRWRQEGTPFNQPCCGSVFKNPSAPVEGHRTAGQLVDAAGLKGLTVGGARVSPMHANYIVNTGGASAADVHRAIDQVRSEVYRRFGVRLETEVKLIQPDGTTLPAA